MQFPFFADTIVNGIEVVGKPSIDSISTNSGENELTYRLLITSFEEGYYRIPRLKLPFTDGKIQDTAQTSPVWLLVNTLPADTTKAPIYDIKQPMEEPITFSEVIPWVGGGILIVGLVFLLILFLSKRKKDEPLFFPRKPLDPPHVVALRELEKIKEKKLWNTENHKHYHTILTDVLRDYIEGRFDVPAMEQTTDETIRSLKGNELISLKLIEQLQETLSLADLVKFARFKPDIPQNEASLDFGFRFVNETKQEQIIEESEEEQEDQKLVNKLPSNKAGDSNSLLLKTENSK